jgi:hypothetical protein
MRMNRKSCSFPLLADLTYYRLPESDRQTGKLFHNMEYGIFNKQENYFRALNT